MSGPKAFAHTVVASTRRSWAAWEKRAIVDEARRTTSSISSVARRHGITPSLLFRWRRERLQQEQSAERPPDPAFVPLVLPSPVETPRPPEEGYACGQDPQRSSNETGNVGGWRSTWTRSTKRCWRSSF